MNIAFVDMSFHIQNTKSSQFFIDELKPLGTVHHISNTAAWRLVPAVKPDIVIIWQLLLTPEEIDMWNCKNVVLIPMYDACPHTLDFWNQYKKYKIFCFSKTLFDILDSAGFNCLYSQYYIKPTTEPKLISSRSKNLNAFFWQRYNKLTWQTIGKVCSTLPISHLHFHSGLAQDNFIKPAEEEIKKYDITFTSWFEDKRDMDKILDTTHIYFSPRLEEGIGLSFIEALARGNLVCAFDAPTMNEYISNEKDGILFNHTDIPAKSFSLKELALMQKASIKRAEEGYKKWTASLDSIRDFISSPLPGYTPKKTIKGIILYLIQFAKHVVKRLIGWKTV